MKSILCFCFLLLGSSVFCQVKVGIQAGYNYSTFLGKDIVPTADYYYHASGLSAFNAGFTSSIPLSKRLSLQPSLLLSEKGAKEKSGGAWSPYYVTHLRIYYAHLPVQLMYTIINRKQWQASVGAGGFISKGIWGTSNTQFNLYSDSTGPLTSNAHSKVNFTNDLYQYNSGKRNAKPWDYGYTLAAAAAWKSWQLKATYDFGLENMAAGDHKSGVFSLSAGYYFWEKKGKPAKK